MVLIITLLAMTATGAVVGAVRASMLDAVVAGTAVLVVGIVWLALSNRTIMRGHFGLQTAIAIAVGVLGLVSYFERNQTGQRLAEAAAALAMIYVLITVIVAFRGWLYRRAASKSKHVP